MEARLWPPVADVHTIVSAAHRSRARQRMGGTGAGRSTETRITGLLPQPLAKLQAFHTFITEMQRSVCSPMPQQHLDAPRNDAQQPAARTTVSSWAWKNKMGVFLISVALSVLEPGSSGRRCWYV
mmetsp:Transcript_3687/g.9297  ORF Transcript_3687/g.9297 Transcript_3687/m.9297 type:complete len:125 (-) Transcript_3687:560-934(-)